MKNNPTAFTVLVQNLQRCAQLDAHILINGEVGTGKRQSALSVHNASERSNNRFVVLNCSGLTDHLFNLELFGKENKNNELIRKGALFMAESGTIYLNEVTDLSLDSQSLLARYLDTGVYAPLDSDNVISANVRLICSTSKNIKALVERGEFRNDLYHSISQMIITTPSLNDRLEDIEMLSKNIFHEITPNHQFSLDSLALSYLQNHSFSGNIIELKNILLRALSLSKDTLISGEVIREAIDAGILYKSELENKITQNDPENLYLHSINNDKNILKPNESLHLNVFDRRNNQRWSKEFNEDKNIIKERFNDVHFTDPANKDLTSSQAHDKSDYQINYQPEQFEPSHPDMTSNFTKSVSLKEKELVMIKDLLIKYDHDKDIVAQHLGCTVRTLYRKITKMKSLGML